MFESLYTYLQYEWQIGVPYETFIRNPRSYYKPDQQERVLARNPMSFLFGLQTDDFDNGVSIAAFLRDVQVRFDFVMIYEYLDESLVLLKELLGWSWNDVIVFRMNSRRSESIIKRPSELQELAARWNWADVELYTLFLKEFYKRVERYGRYRMENDVMLLRKMRSRRYEECVDAVIPNSVLPGLSYSMKEGADDRCALLLKDEPHFTEDIKHKLWPNVQFTDVLKKYYMNNKTVIET